ncbi:MAG: branched-chain amino acid aminotransferase [Bacteroidetes bacterium]|nr:MAG: branched-chain amino acid aminotransferase [Bacteroidota bacterium]
MKTLERNIRIKQVAESRIHEVDMNNIPFGRVFSDHMLIAHYRDGQWQAPEIRPYGKLELEPSISSLNYGQSIFEGMKAHRGPQGEALLFRPEANWKRLNRSAARMCMPEVPASIFLDGLQELIRLDQAWIPAPEQGALYIRPLYFATDEFIGVKASETYTFVIFTCPVGPYYTRPVRLLVTKDYIRAAIGGTGSAKTCGNYAASLLPDKLAKARGYDNVLWLDAREHRFIEECGTMNVFFVIDGTVITPPLSGTILPGITRDSLIRLLKDHDYKIEVRPISIYEVEEAYEAGYLQEAFGAGTAATVTHIEAIGFGGRDLVFPPVDQRPVSQWLGQQLEALKSGTAKDPYGWRVKVE